MGLVLRVRTGLHTPVFVRWCLLRSAVYRRLCCQFCYHGWCPWAIYGAYLDLYGKAIRGAEPNTGYAWACSLVFAGVLHALISVRGFELPIVPFGAGLCSALMGLLSMEWWYFCPMLSSFHCSSLSILLSVLVSLVVGRWGFSLVSMALPVLS